MTARLGSSWSFGFLCVSLVNAFILFIFCELLYVLVLGEGCRIWLF